MPVPIGTRENRDEEHKQAIIEFEKTVIEPVLTQLIQSEPSEEEKPMIIGFHTGLKDDKSHIASSSIYYYIGDDATEKLGNNRDYIVKVIGEIYQSEGYKVEYYKHNEYPAAWIKQN